MFRREVYKALYEGKDVRYATWAEGKYIRLDSKGYIRDQDGFLHNLNAKEFDEEGDGWGIYKPKPKRMVKKWRWLYKKADGFVGVTEEHYKSIEDAGRHYAGLIQKLPDTEQMVEEIRITF